MIRVVFNLKRWLLVRLAVGSNVKLERDVHIGPFSVVSAPRHLSIGENTYIGKFCTIQANGRIGRGVLIANSVGVVGRRDHAFRPAGTFVRDGRWVGSDDGLADDPANAVTISDDVWVGYGSIILSGIKIGRGAIVAAGSVVRDDVPAYAIVSGNPAEQVGQRFDGTAANEHDAAIVARYGSITS